LVRRLPRTPQAFAEETRARNIVRYWEWTDVDPPRDLREAFLIHTVHTRESQRSAASILDGYKQTVRVALADGFLTREEVQQLQSTVHRALEGFKQLQETGNGAKGVVDKMRESVQDTMHEMVKRVKPAADLLNQVQQHPWLLMGSAILTGYILGSLASEHASSR
jgi:ElaB/YqjD/DUF883 family membrane-anchored ribosome-binding protein